VVLGGFAALVLGLAPRAVMLVWSAFALCFFLGSSGELLDVPGWVMDVSPFSHIPDVPATNSPSDHSSCSRGSQPRSSRPGSPPSGAATSRRCDRRA